MSAMPPTATESMLATNRRDVPILLQKSPRRSCRIKMRNNRIGVNGFLNQPCALIPDLESIMRARMRKIVLQHNLPLPDSCTAVTNDVWAIETEASTVLRLSMQ